MKDETIALIVDEVVRRIKLLINTHRCLVIIRENTDYSLLNTLLLTMNNNGFVFDVLALEEPNEDILIDCSIKAINFVSEYDLRNNVYSLKQYETVIISNLKILEISKLISLQIENQFLHFIYEILKEGISLYGFSKDLEIKNNLKLQSMVTRQCALLEEIGLKIISKRNDASTSLSNQIITLEQVKDMNEKSLFINKEAIVTNAAKDYLTQNKIEIFRR